MEVCNICPNVYNCHKNPYTCENYPFNHSFKFLIEMYDIATDKSNPIIIYDTIEQAEMWIEKEMKDKNYNGTGYYRIKKVKYC